MFISKSEKIRRRLNSLNDDGWLYKGLPGLHWETANARKGDRNLMRQMAAELLSDFRIHEFYHACINCGNCTAVCPAFQFVDFTPRVVVQKVMAARTEPELLYQMMDQYIWACFQCYSCWSVCPAENNPGGLIAILKEIGVRQGLRSARKTLEPYSRILYKLMTTGTQITPDMHSTIALFRDWGPHKKELADHLKEYRDSVPVESMAGVLDKSWRVDPETMRELKVIEKEAGVIDMLRKSLPNVADAVEEYGGEYRAGDDDRV